MKQYAISIGVELNNNYLHKKPTPDQLKKFKNEVEKALKYFSDSWEVLINYSEVVSATNHNKHF